MVTGMWLLIAHCGQGYILNLITLFGKNYVPGIPMGLRQSKGFVTSLT
jgi:hypothetical protein